MTEPTEARTRWQSIAPNTWTRLESDPDTEICHTGPGIMLIATRKASETAPEEPFDRLVRLTETHLRMLKAKDFSAPLVNRLRRDDCMHDWSAPAPLRGHDDAIDCLECGLRVLDGYRPYYPRKAS